MTEVDWTSELHDQLDWHWQHGLRPRLEGLTDEEYLWEPVPGCWSLRARADATTTDAAGGGDLVLDYVWPDPTPAPVKGYSDCVLAARVPLIEKNPAAVKAVIKALFVAQSQAETDKTAALKDTVGKYYKTSMEAAVDASNKQPLVVDQRDQTQFIIDRGASMQELGYVKKMPDKGAFDWSLLEAVIAENKPLYDGLKLKSA